MRIEQVGLLAVPPFAPDMSSRLMTPNTPRFCPEMNKRRGFAALWPRYPLST